MLLLVAPACQCALHSARRRSTICAAEGRVCGSVCRQSRMSCDTPAGQASEGGGGCTKPRRGTSWVTISHRMIPKEKESARGMQGYVLV